MRKPLRRQIMLPVLAVTAISLTAVGAINVKLAARQTRQRTQRQLQGVVAVLATSNFPLTHAVLRQMRELSRAEFVLADEAGNCLVTSLEEIPGPLPIDLTQSSPASAGLGPSLNLGNEFYFHTITDLRPRNGIGQSQKLHVLFPQREYRRTWREAVLPSIAVGLVTMIAVAVVAHGLASRLSRAASRLSGEVLRMARGDFGPAELPARDDELRDLSIAVNRTAEMLADYRDQVRRTEQMRTAALLGAGLAHEMRNAATGCRMALDLHAESCNAGADGESLVVAKRQLRLMESQLQRFLHVGKPVRAAIRQAVDLAELVDQLLPLVRPAARHARAELAWKRPLGDAVVLADEEDLRQVVLNLILNAIEAVQQTEPLASRAVEVVVDVDQHDQVELVVSDSGPGPSHGVAGTLFEPFVSTKPEGVGLGLAVARQIVEAHHGTMRWTRSDERTRFRLELPRPTEGSVT